MTQLPQSDANRKITMDTCLRLCGCLVQGFQISDHNLLILPHITNVDIARLQQKKVYKIQFYNSYFKKSVKTIFDFIKLPPKLKQYILY